MSSPLLPGDIFSDLDAIRRRLDTLERSTGYQQSMTIVDSSGTTRVKAGALADGSYGLQVNDAAGVARFLTTTDGFQVNDATGAMIMDSVGLAGTAKVLAQGSSGASFDTPGIGTGWTNIAGVNGSFTITSRPKTVLALIDAPCAALAGVGGPNGMSVSLTCYTGSVGGALFQQSISHLLTFDSEIQGATIPMWLTLPVGTYAVGLTARCNSGTSGTLWLWSWSLLVLQLGG